MQGGFFCYIYIPSNFKDITDEKKSTFSHLSYLILFHLREMVKL